MAVWGAIAGLFIGLCILAYAGYGTGRNVEYLLLKAEEWEKEFEKAGEQGTEEGCDDDC